MTEPVKKPCRKCSKTVLAFESEDKPLCVDCMSPVSAVERGIQDDLFELMERSTTYYGHGIGFRRSDPVPRRDS